MRDVDLVIRNGPSPPRLIFPHHIPSHMGRSHSGPQRAKKNSTIHTWLRWDVSQLLLTQSDGLIMLAGVGKEIIHVGFKSFRYHICVLFPRNNSSDIPLRDQDCIVGMSS